jgi:hydroxyacid-oxoacid transhydrogenase
MNQNFETVFTMDTSSIKYGVGATREIGHDMAKYGVKRVLVMTDPNLSNSEPVQIVMEALKAQGIDAVKYDQVRIEPTDTSFKHAIAFAQDGNFDGYVAIGGGSTIDTAKVANLYATYPPDDFLDYVNAPIGKAKPVPGVVKPLIAIPTTAGTGSETTGVAIFDLQSMHVKTGISHRYLRPLMGIIDPLNTATLPAMASACSGLDVLSHALESLTAVPFNKRPAPDTPQARPAYQGANPISDIWTSKAIEMVAQYQLRAIQDTDDIEARGNMLMAAAFAGIGFGNSGVHLPHAMSYPVSGMVRDYKPEGYNTDWALIPHGMSVILNAPAVFRWTAQADPQRHLYAAQLLGADTRGASEADAGEVLAQAIIKIMQATGMPNGLRAVGFDEEDIPQLVEGTLAQQRLTKLAPLHATKEVFEQLFSDAMTYW